MTTFRGRELTGLVLVSFIFILGMILIAAAGGAKPIDGDIMYSAPITALLILFFAGHLVLSFRAGQTDQLILPLCVFLSVMGLLGLKSLDMSFADQIRWVELGLICALAVAVLVPRPEKLGEYKYIAGAVGLVLLLAPAFFGIVRGGSKLWLTLGGVTFQPAEPAKVMLTIFLAAYLADKKEVLREGGLRHFGPLIITWVLSMIILIFERDLGSSLIFFSLFLVLFYIATGRISFVFIGLGLFFVGAAAAYKLFSHVAARIDVWLAPLPSDVGGSAYQVAQSLFALNAGGLAGTGLGGGLLGRAISMPAVHTDFIFTSLAEELGLAGSAAIIIAFLLLAGRGFLIGLSCRNDFLALLAVGLAFVTAIQAAVIIGGVMKIIPLTGVTLPFVSYGGSSIVSSFIMAGLLMSISGRSGADRGGRV